MIFTRKSFLWIIMACIALLFCGCNLLLPNKVANPVFTPPAGNYTQSQLISITSETEGAEIRYTLDGDDPPANSQVYTGPFTVSLGTQVKAQANKPGMEGSEIVAAFYSGITPIPVFSLSSGYYIAGTIVHIEVDDNGLSYNSIIVRYTLDGTDPDNTSAIYGNGIVISHSCSLKAKTYYKNWNPSSIASAVYTTTAETVATPQITPGSGNVLTGSSFSLSCATSGAVTRYTTNGDDPTEQSLLYSDPVTITQPGVLIINAKSFKEYWNPSPSASATYTVTSPTVATPVFNPSGGSVLLDSDVSISCTTQNAVIRYTMDGSQPDENSQVYTNPITLDQLGPLTLRAAAFKQYYQTSTVSYATYNVIIEVPPLVVVSGGTFNNGISNVTLTSFRIGQYEVTQHEYQMVMSNNPSNFSGVNKPVDSVSWYNAIEYCNLLSIMLGLTPCYSYSTYGTNPSNWPSGWDQSIQNHNGVSCNWSATGYRLPTEMEWMFAGRGGNQTHNYVYSGSNSIDSVAWYWDNAGSTTHIIGTKASNELEIYDMSGNVSEWVWDVSGDYPSGSQTNPHGPNNGTYRTSRGGCWGSVASYCTLVYRMHSYPTLAGNSSGFRICKRN